VETTFVKRDGLYGLRYLPYLAPSSETPKNLRPVLKNKTLFLNWQSLN
jgi:hypothetical protein